MKLKKFAGLLAGLSLSAGVYAGDVQIEAVKVTAQGGGHYHFAVTLRHADTGWDHYANAWDVVSTEGEKLGERILHHPHVNEQPFTRSQVIRIPQGTKQVEVRAYDSVHGLSEMTYKVTLP